MLGRWLGLVPMGGEGKGASMRVIIAGSRNIVNYDIVEEAIEKSKFTISEVVSGAAKGVDTLGEEWAENNKKYCKRFPADWDTYGKSAGIIRNVHMADYADALIAVWNGSSRGTQHMIKTAKDRNLKVFVHLI